MEAISVILPALNEPHLHTFLSQLTEYDVNVRDEKGLSFAVWKGIRQSTNNVLVIMDADGSHPVEAIPHMTRLLNNDVWLVVGSRYCEGGYSYDSPLRKMISLFYCKVAQIILRTKMKDAMSGFWVGYRHAFTFKPSRNYKFGIQLIKAHEKNIKEYPIIFSKRKEGKSHVQPIQALRDFFTILQR